MSVNRLLTLFYLLDIDIARLTYIYYMKRDVFTVKDKLRYVLYCKFIFYLFSFTKTKFDNTNSLLKGLFNFKQTAATEY